MKRKKVVLIGDSIRRGYETAVEDLLGTSWEVLTPKGNCRTILDIVGNLDRWILRYRPDVVHLNAGLHDISRDPERHLPSISPWCYARALSDIFQTLGERSDARIIWATITPVDEARQRETALALRHEADVVLYNRIATKLTLEWGVELNDLYSRALLLGSHDLLEKDGVHFSPQGYLFLARNVVEVIERGRDIDTSSYENMV